ncbi:hypothetical protein SERLA73DRAFT_173171 [Serpula lacrymans var. lacrymans S7.3]|uniref:Uncharacterized protein n=1 Tax=Serpula lacrymans var. lacrymans (strain S7.3) TaxID=936435 RepID=F8QI34_SERL3|nr:hypothetical protein SERLA73DRAFT_173171 [Serpula lacrymans var. lacrymans S7.3]
MNLQDEKRDRYIQDDIEQDQIGGDDLPTYDDLAAQSGPNSRFGRWRGWIEKRAAERYADITPDELDRRRARGWGGESRDSQSDRSIPAMKEPSTASVPPLRIRINDGLSTDVPQVDASPTPVEPPSQPPGELLSPTHLKLHQFGSRFLPHSTSPIRCVLPLQSDRLLLIGHDSGLSVLNMFPSEWVDTGGLVQKGPNEAQARPIWEGEAVYQMSVLESEDSGEGTPKGVVLVLVGPDTDTPSTNHEKESIRTLRMYNLASLTSLAKWTIAQQSARPLDLQRPSEGNPQQTPSKRHRHASSLTKGLRNLMAESPTRHTPEPQPSSYQSFIPSLKPPQASRQSTQSSQSTAATTDSTWDVVDDLPLRWATDFVPFAAPGSRLLSASVISYALWQEGQQWSRALLAVATKSNIFLYEKPKNERAFHFVKEFYTPLQPRNLIFVQQSVQDIYRSPSDVGHSRVVSSDASTGLYSARSAFAAPLGLSYGAQTALFIVFEKKAGIIRIADAAVTEVDLYDSTQTANVVLARRSRASYDFGYTKEGKGAWVLPSQADLPFAQSPYQNLMSGNSRPAGGPGLRSVYFLTRGKQTHIVPCPLPATLSTAPPLHTIMWKSPPGSVSARICHPGSGHSPFLQLIGMGEDGVEVQEVPLPLSAGGRGKGKGKAVAEPPQAQAFIGEAGFLTSGGNWHRPMHPTPLIRNLSAASVVSTTSFDSLETDEIATRLRAEQGIYGWWRKDLEDWRIFWVGGDGREDSLGDEGESNRS